MNYTKHSYCPILLSFIFLFFSFKKKLSIWLQWVLVVGMWDLCWDMQDFQLPHVGSSSLMLDWPWACELKYGVLATGPPRKSLFHFLIIFPYQYRSVSSVAVMSDPLQPHGLQHARLPCPSPTPWACSNSCPSSQWCHPSIASSVFPFSSCLQSFPASGSFPRSQSFASDEQSIGASASASVFPMNIQDWFP